MGSLGGGPRVQPPPELPRPGSPRAPRLQFESEAFPRPPCRIGPGSHPKTPRMSPKLVFLIGLPAVVVGLVLGVLLSDSIGGAGAAADGAAPPALAAGPSGPTLASGPGGSSESLALDPRGPSTVSASAPAQSAPRAEVELSSTRVAQAADAVVLPEVEALAGPGVFVGEVLSLDGAPLSGVWVEAVASSFGNFDDASEIGSGAPPVRSLEEALQEAAEDWAQERARRVHTQTDSAGRFSLSGLDPQRRYRLNAYREGWTFRQDLRRGSIRPGTEVRFFGSQVVPVTVQLVGPDGSPYDEGAIEVEFADDNEDYGWSAAEPVLRLPVGRARLRGHAEVFEHERLRGNAYGGLRSDWIDVNLEAGTAKTVTLAVEPRVGLFGKLIDPENWGTLESFRVVAQELGPGESLDEETLISKSEHSANVRYGGYSLLDLPTGRLAIGVASRNNELYASAEIELPDGLLEHDFQVQAPEADRYLILRASDPEGRPLLDMDLDLRRERENGRSNGYGLSTRIRPDGSLALYGAKNFYEPWDEGERWFLVAEHNLLGENRIELAEGQREVDWVFQPPCSLEILVQGAADSPHADKLTVGVYAMVGDGDNLEYRRAESRGTTKPDADGLVRLTGIAPGTYAVRLNLSQNGNRRGWGGSQVLASREMEIRSGENSTNLSMPALHDLVVYSPEAQEGQSVWAIAQNEDQERRGYWNYIQGSFGPDLRARLEGLPAGRYTVQSQESGRSITVDVPCGEVLLERQVNNALRVSLSSEEGSLYRAGLRPGDHIVGIGGSRMDDANEIQSQLGGSGSITLLVQRSDGTVDLTVDRTETPLTGGSSTLGGSMRQVTLD